MPDRFEPTTELISRTMTTLSKTANRRVIVDVHQATRLLDAVLRTKGVHVYVDGVRARPQKVDVSGKS